MSMDIRWWWANGGTEMGKPGGTNQLPIYPPGYRAQRDSQTARTLAYVLNANGIDELEQLLHVGELEAGSLDVLQGALGIPKSFAQLNPSAASYVKGPTVSSVVTGKSGAAIATQQAKDAATAEQYWRDNPPKNDGPAMVATAGASPEEIAQVAAYNEARGLDPAKAEQARTKGFLESISLGVPEGVYSGAPGKGLLGAPGLGVGGTLLADAVKNDGPTMVATAGASPEEIAQVAAYNEAHGKAPVTAAAVPGYETGTGGLLGNLVRAITGGVTQATGGGAAQTALGSLLGLGLGGPAFGSGALPGNLGQTVAQTFGTTGLPAAYARGVDGRLGMTGYAYDPTWQRFAAIGDYAGSTVARSLLGVTQPELSSIRAMLERQAAQTQATHEARVIASTREFRREVIGRLRDLARMVMAHDARVGAGGYFETRRY